tara:strand:- start:6720 stop:7205 length:486 start_codon:yes stop_codon:yes gene_type:complete
MIAKIKHITENGHYDSPHGRLYKQMYTFDDSVEVSANHKSEASPFKIGEEVEYEIGGSNSYGNWGRVRKPDSEGKYTKSNTAADGDRSVVIERSWAMGQAVSMMGSLPARNHSAVVEYMKDMCVLAETILLARDTFPKFDQDDAVRARWGAAMAEDNEMPF